jgi:hypothetical protein
MTYALQLLTAAHDAFSNHEDVVGRSEVCACFYCLKTLSPAEITEWVEEARRRPNRGLPALRDRLGDRFRLRLPTDTGISGGHVRTLVQLAWRDPTVGDGYNGSSDKRLEQAGTVPFADVGAFRAGHSALIR